MTIIYGRPGCTGCTATKRFMTEKSIDHNYVDVEQDEEAMTQAMSYGFKQLPIVVTDSDAWSGFDPMKLKTLTPAV